MEFLNFIDKYVYEDKVAKNIDTIVTRFPPEPNGYLHIGSAYAINISYSIKEKYNGRFNLRFDDTNPANEDIEYVNAIIDDLNWLGCDFRNKPFYGSDYSQAIFDYAVYLIKKGKAFVCDLTFEQMREYRGTLTEPGKNSPYRDRSVEENLDLFYRMKNGEFGEGEKVLRAKINMEDPNVLLRDPVIYRILNQTHYRTKDEWVIYPMYDFAHPIQDYIEGVTHSLCSNEFINHRPFYNWTLEQLDLDGILPRQIEFGRLNMTGVVTSKRYLKKLVATGSVEGWDDPRLPTIKGLRRRGITKDAIFAFVNEIGVPKDASTVDYKMLEHFVREDLRDDVKSLMLIKNPLKVVITNYDGEEIVTGHNHPNDESFGSRDIWFTKEIYIEKDDFMEVAPNKKYKRLSVGEEVRLRHAYFIKCNEVIKDENGDIVELRCTYDKETKSGSGFTGRKPRGTIHWVSATRSKNVTVNDFEDLFLEQPTDETLLDCLNPNSKTVYSSYLESSAYEFVKAGEERFQFIRNGFYFVDPDSTDENVIFNQIVPLKSTFKMPKK